MRNVDLDDARGYEVDEHGCRVYKAKKPGRVGITTPRGKVQSHAYPAGSRLTICGTVICLPGKELNCYETEDD